MSRSGSVIPLIIAWAVTAGEPTAVRDPEALPVPFERFHVVDRHGRTLDCYLSKPPKNHDGKPLPLVLCIGGSGGQSLFMKVGDRVGGGFQMIALKAARGRARILCVEKPGVKFLEQLERPGSALGTSAEFRREHTLDRWRDANVDAVKALRKLPGVDLTRLLALGHSEGADVVGHVAAELPEVVTHAAPLAGGGPTQLFGLAELATRPQPGDTTDAVEKRRDAFYREWDRVRADPDSIDAMWMGHPHRRWTTFLAKSPIEALCRSKAKVYLAHGTEDTSVPIADFDVARAELKARGRAVVAERLIGVDHGYAKPGDPPGPPKGFEELLGRVFGWFLGPTSPSAG
jgi:dipeptidyl aminopeptidase/acylaminoacyl peptidase